MEFSRGEDFYARLEIHMFKLLVDLFIKLFGEAAEMAFTDAINQLRFTHCFGCDPLMFQAPYFSDLVERYVGPTLWPSVQSAIAAMRRMCDEAGRAIGREGDALVNVLEIGVETLGKEFERRFDNMIGQMCPFDAARCSNRLGILPELLAVAKHYSDSGSAFMRHCGLLGARLHAIGISADNVQFLYTEMSKLFLPVEAKVANETVKLALASTRVVFRIVMESFSLKPSAADKIIANEWLHARDGPAFAAAVYASLFSLDPSLRETVFRRTSVDSIQASFLRMIHSLFLEDGLDYESADSLRRLGVQHNIWGVKADYYYIFASSLALAVRQLSPATETVSEVSWLKVIEAITDAMIYKNSKIVAAVSKKYESSDIKRFIKVQALHRGRMSRKATSKLRLMKSGTLEDIIAFGDDTDVDWESETIGLSPSDRAIIKLSWSRLGDMQHKAFLDAFVHMQSQSEYKSLFEKVAMPDLSKRVCRFFNKLVDQVDQIESLSSVFSELRCMHQVTLKVTLDMYHELGKELIESILKHFPDRLHSAIRIPFALFYQSVVVHMVEQEHGGR